MKYERLTIILILMALGSALLSWGIYTFPFRVFGSLNFWDSIQIISALTSLLFLLCPVLALVSYLKKSKACYFWLGIYAPIASIFGVAPVPFLKFFYSGNTDLNTILIAVLNGLLVYSAWRLYSANKAVQWNAPGVH